MFEPFMIEFRKYFESIQLINNMKCVHIESESTLLPSR